MPTQNSMIIGKNTYQCRKCEKTLELKHLVWFVKHYKFCGFDDTKANEILGVDDEDCEDITRLGVATQCNLQTYCLITTGGRQAAFVNR